MELETVATIDKLSKRLKNIQKWLQCAICLHDISDPVKIPCGHRFCRKCIQKVVKNKTAQCPCCNTRIQRRSVSKDELMAKYIDGFKKLVTAIHMDSGIDILSHVPRPESTRESTWLDNTNDEELVQPSCSGTDLQKKQPERLSNRSRRSSKESKGQKDKEKSEQKDSLPIARYLADCGLSGIEPLLSGESKEKSRDEKVHDWLNAIPKSALLEVENADKNAMQPEEYDLDDTIIPDSDNVQNKSEYVDDKYKESAEEVTLNCSCHSTPKTSRVTSKDEDNKKESHKPVDKSSEIVHDLYMENAVPSTSDVNNLRNDSKKKDQVVQEVQRTSPSDMLAASKETWSSVIQFGKEMSKERKFKSLNVSIEKLSVLAINMNKGKITNLESAEIGKDKKKSESHFPKNVLKSDSKKESMKESKKKNILRENEKNEILDETQKANVSFIELEEGKKLRIRYLKNNEMKTIIGVSPEKEKVYITEKSRHSNDKCVDSNNIPFQSEKSNIESNDNVSFLRLMKDVDLRSKICSPILSKSSSKKRSFDSKKNEFLVSNDKSRLQAVRRDLNHQIDQNRENADVDKKSVKETDKSEKNKCSENNEQQAARRVKNITVTPIVPFCLEKNPIRFIKVGRIFKQRKKHIPFLYLGSTRPTRGMNHCALIKDKACSPIKHASKGNENNRPLEDEVEDITPVKKAKSVSETKSASNSKFNEDEQQISRHIKPTTNIEQHVINKTTTMKNTTDNVSEKSRNSEVFYVDSDDEKDVGLSPKLVKPTDFNEIRMLSPTNDSQLRLLSLESPPMDTPDILVQLHKPELSKDSTLKNSENLPVTLQVSDGAFASFTPIKSTKQLNSGEILPQKLVNTFENDIVINDDDDSNNSLSSQITWIRNPNKEKSIKPSLSPVTQLFPSSVKDNGTVFSTSDKDILTSIRFREGQCKSSENSQILNRSHTDLSNVILEYNLVNNVQSNKSPASKRKRDVSPDSDCEVDLNAITNNWYKEVASSKRCKKGRTDKPSDSAFRGTKDNYLARSDSANSSKFTNKPSPFKRRALLDLTGNPSNGKSNCVKTLREIDAGVVDLDKDSPDFMSTIDKVKDIQNKVVVSKEKCDEHLMQDNFDEVIANINSIDLISEYNNEMRGASKSRVCDCENSSEEKSVPSKNSDKQNKYNVDAISSDRNDNNKSRQMPSSLPHETSDMRNISETNENLKKKRDISMKSAGKELVNVPMNTSTASSVYKEPVQHPDKDNSMVKDTNEQDSLTDVTQDSFMLKQFEVDLFGKFICSKATVEKQLKTPEQLKRNEKSSNAHSEDVEHSCEEDYDIVENTPDTKKRKLDTPDSQRRKEMTTPTSNIIKKSFDYKTYSTSGQSSSNLNTPTYKIQPLHQSTPKTPQSCFTNNSNNNTPTRHATTSSSSNMEAKSIAKNVTVTQKDWSTRRERLCFVCSGLIPSQIENVRRLAQTVSAKYLSQFDPEVTHVIVRVNEQNGTKQTLKYLQGVAHRKWIVGYQWVLDSLKENRLKDEEPYEAVEFKTLEAGPRNSRLREKNLFEEFVFLCKGPFDNVSVEQYQDLLRAMGATVLNSLEALAAERRKLKIIVFQSDIYEFEIIQKWYKQSRAIPIVHEWILECISRYKLTSFASYMQEIEREEAIALGFPEHLVEMELDSYST